MGDYDSTFGALLIGCMIGVFLFGINTSQTWIYMRSYPNDPWQMKTFIVVVWFLEFVHTMLAGWAVYWSLVTNYDASDLAQADSGLNSIMCISSLVAVSITSLVQMFFTYRLYKLSNFVVVPFIAATLSLVRLSCYMGATIYRLLYGVQTKGWVWSMFLVGILSITSDLLVAIGLSYSLWKRRTLWKAHSDNVSWWPRIIDQLIIISLQADAFICIISTITLILHNVSSNFLWMAISLVACKLFPISCLASIFSARKLSRKTDNMPTLAAILGSTTMPSCNPASRVPRTLLRGQSPPSSITDGLTTV